MKQSTWLRASSIWAIVLLVCIVPLVVAANSPLLEWRQPVYIVAGFTGAMALSLMLLQPLFVLGLLPSLSSVRNRDAHLAIGFALIVLVLLHVVGLWITSPPDVIDALLFRSATPFSIWGVIAMWSLLLTAGFVLLRRRIRLRAPAWRLSHRLLAALTVIGTVLHAMMIDGTMGLISKSIVCALLLIALLLALFLRRVVFLSR